MSVVLFLSAIAGGVAWYVYAGGLAHAQVTRIVRGSVVRAVPANVLVLAEANEEIKADYGGRVVNLAVKRGAEVKKGDLIFELDVQDLDLEIRRIESDIKAIDDRLKLGSPLRFEVATAEETVRTNTRLFADGRISQIEFDRSKRAVDQVKDRLANEEIQNRQSLTNLQIALDQKKLQKQRMQITAPFDGTITDLYARANTLVGPGTALARIISRERLVQAQISEENFAAVRPNLTANVQFLGYGYQQFTATVDRVLPSADEKTRRYTAFLSVNIPQEQLIPDLTGEASIVVERKENVLVAPVRAMMGHNLVLVKEGRVAVTHTMVGVAGGGVIEIERGVAEGDLVVARDPAEFQDGQRVRVVMPPATAK